MANKNFAATAHKVDPILTPTAAAQFIGKSEASLRLYALEGKLPCLVTTTGRRLFRQSELEEFLRKISDRPSRSASGCFPS